MEFPKILYFFMRLVIKIYSNSKKVLMHKILQELNTISGNWTVRMNFMSFNDYKNYIHTSI